MLLAGKQGENGDHVPRTQLQFCPLIAHPLVVNSSSNRILKAVGDLENGIWYSKHKMKKIPNKDWACPDYPFESSPRIQFL